MCSRSGIRAHKYRGTGSNYIHYPGRWARVSRVTSYCLPGVKTTQPARIFLSQMRPHTGSKGLEKWYFWVHIKEKIKLFCSWIFDLYFKHGNVEFKVWWVNWIRDHLSYFWNKCPEATALTEKLQCIIFKEEIGRINILNLRGEIVEFCQT